MTIAATIAADCALQRPTRRAIARRAKRAHRADRFVEPAAALRATSTSAPLLTVPTSVVPRRASARS